MEHSLNLGVSHILSRITPVQRGKTHDTENDNEDDDIEELSAGDAPSEDSISSALHKLLGLIKQVRRIHCQFVISTNPYFRYECQLKPVHSSSECVTTSRSWSLSSSCLSGLGGLQCLYVWVVQSISNRYSIHIASEDKLNLPTYPQAVTRFTQLADDSEDVPALRNKKYRDFRPSKDEWEQLKLLHEVMQVRHCIHMLYRC